MSSEATSDAVLVRPAKSEDRLAWQSLWERYLVFYESELPSDRTELLWARILDSGNSIECLVAEADGQVVGIVQFFPHPDTWEAHPICYLQDLYVDDARRGLGIGEALIRAVQQRCTDNDWVFVYWQTAQDNARARGLYDKLTGGPTGFVVYQLGSRARQTLQGLEE
jgi:ribosomal protein S18 acetylase RimI-like enzyme